MFQSNTTNVNLHQHLFICLSRGEGSPCDHCLWYHWSVTNHTHGTTWIRSTRCMKSTHFCFFEEIRKFWLDFTMVAYGKIYFEAQINNQYSWFKNNTTQFYFILGRAELHWNFCSIPMDGSDIHRFSNRKWVLTMCTVGNLWISEPSLGILEKFQHSSALPNIRYNCVVLLLSQLYWLFIYA